MADHNGRGGFGAADRDLLVTIYYLDNNRGNDNNSGLSPALAWKNLAKITNFASAQPGDAFLLADDSDWPLTPNNRVAPPTSWLGNKRNPVTIGSYSPSSQSIGQRPIVRLNYLIQPSDWLYDAALNGWTYLYPTAHINRAVLLRINDSWLASTYDMTVGAPVESVDGRFNIMSAAQTLAAYGVSSANQGIILYAPAGIDPTTYYGKVMISAQAAGAFTLSSGRKCITIQDISFRETGCGVLLYSQDTLQADFIARRLHGHTTNGLVVINAFSPGVLRAAVRDCTVENAGAIGIHVVNSGGAGLSYAEVSNNRVKGGGYSWIQGGIYVQCRTTTRDGICVVSGNEISGWNWGSQGKGADGSGIYVETGADGCLITGNVIHDCYTGIQDNSGRRNTFTGNLVYNVRQGVRISDQSENQLMEHRSFNNTFLVGDLNQSIGPYGSTQGQDYPGFWMYRPASPVGKIINVTAKNNIIANVGGGRGRAAFGLAEVTATATYDLDGNWLYGFERDTENTVSFAQTVLANINNLDPRPFLTESYRLRSPYLIGGIPMLNPLAGMGAYVPGVRLMDGRRPEPGRVPVGACAEGGY